MANPNGQASIVIIGSYLVALVMDVDRIPTTGETLLARNFREAFGGKGSDMAVQAARLGAPVDFVGCVGDDDFGRAFTKLMEDEGVNIDHLRASSELATGAGFIIKDMGEPQHYHHRYRSQPTVFSCRCRCSGGAHGCGFGGADPA